MRGFVNLIQSHRDEAIVSHGRLEAHRLLHKLLNPRMGKGLAEYRLGAFEEGEERHWLWLFCECFFQAINSHLVEFWSVFLDRFEM